MRTYCKLYCIDKHYQTNLIRKNHRYCLLCKRENSKARYKDPIIGKQLLQRSKEQYQVNKLNPIFKWKVFLSHLYRKYKLTELQYLQMLWKTKSNCYSCGSYTLKICVDHDHRTEKVRGLLCHSCNKTLGLLKDNYTNLENLRNYVIRYN